MVKASVIWLNYNSMKFIDIVLESLESFLNLNFDDYEIIIVDNASSDGSFEIIKNNIIENKRNVKVKIIRNERNLGYTGGMNRGWEARDPDSKYVAFVNNDLIATPESLSKLVECLESESDVGACSGLIYFGDGKTIYSAGGWVDETWIASGICMGFSRNDCPNIDKEYYATYADGAYSAVKAEIIRKVMPHGKPFFDETFLYLDDYLLGIVLWNKGFKVKYVPYETGSHFHGLTIGELVSFYKYRAHIALSYLVSTRYSFIRKMLMLERQMYRLLSETKWRAVREGIILGKSLVKKLGKLNLYCAPYLSTPLLNAISLLLPKWSSNRPIEKKVDPNVLSYRLEECK